MSEQNQAVFEGWAVLELMGHQRETGFVKTEYFGGAALFRVDVPDIPEREWVLTAPEWTSEGMIPAGSTVKREAVHGRTRFVAPGALYAMNPCDEAAARKAIEHGTPRAIKLVKMAEGKQLVARNEEDEYIEDVEDRL